MAFIRSSSVSTLCLVAAILTYGLFGSPTPNDPGVVEGVVGACLFFAVALKGVFKIFDYKSATSSFLKFYHLFFILGLVVPFFSAIFWNNDYGLILRDVLAFMFLGLPLFFKGGFQEPGVQRYLPWFVMFAGFAFCLRTLMPVLNIWIPQGELLYLSNSPMATMAAVFLILTIWRRLENFHPASLLTVMLMILALGIVLSAMLLDVQRATMGAVFISVFVLALCDFFESPKRTFFPLLLMILLLFFISPWLFQAASEMATKTASVGLNARVEEALAVYDAISVNAATYLFGRGWGAVFPSPAVAGLDVNYTHSFITTMMLKGGMVLCAVSLAMVAMALREIFFIFQGDKIRGLCVFWPFVIPVFLYASHKSLDFGLVLFIISMWSVKASDGQDPGVALENKGSINTQKTVL